MNNCRSLRRRLGCILSSLLVASVACFLSALFLLSHHTLEPTRLGGHPTSVDHDSLTITHVGPSSKRSFVWNPGERYLAYLPHSGFHNQRIALENALVLARILNRTLLVPPAHLGSNVFSYHKFDELNRLLVHSGKQGLLHCSEVPSHVSPPECWDYYDHTHVSWDWLVDLSSVAVEQPLFHHELFTYPWLENPPLDANTLRLRDQTAYDYRLVACALRGANASAGGSAEVHALERRLVPANAGLPPPRDALRVDVDYVSPVASPGGGAMRARACAGKQQHEERALVALNVPLFVATDMEDAPALAPLHTAFPCMVLLRDLVVPEVRALGRLVSAEDGVRPEERRVGKECRSRWSAYL